MIPLPSAGETMVMGRNMKLIIQDENGEERASHKVGYGTKMGLAPMHTWLPDAHSEAPSPASALLSGVLLNCAYLGIFKTAKIMHAAGLSGFSDELTVTTLSASTPLIYGEDFNTGSVGQFSTVSVTSTADWEPYEYPTGSGEWFARINGYGADMESDDWLISPALNLYAYDGAYLTADLAYNYDGPEIEVRVSDNYDPGVHTDPNDAHWIDLGAAMPSTGSPVKSTIGSSRGFVRSR